MSGLQVELGWGDLGKRLSAVMAGAVDVIRPRRESSAVGWAVRRTWNAGGAHEFVGWKPTRQQAERFRDADAAYWWRGPIRPKYELVQISWHEFRAHHREHRFCAAGDCTVAQLLISQ